MTTGASAAEAGAGTPAAAGAEAAGAPGAKAAEASEGKEPPAAAAGSEPAAAAPETGKKPAKKAEPATAAAETGKKPAKKVTIRKSLADRINLFNVSGELKSQLSLKLVALPLSRLEEQDALDVLDALLEASDEVEDVNAFVCKRARELAQELAVKAAAAEEAEAHAGGHSSDLQGAEEAEESAGEDVKPAPKRRRRVVAKEEAAQEEEAAPEEEAAQEEEEAPAQEYEEVLEEMPEVALKRRVKELNQAEALWEPIRFKRLKEWVPVVGAEAFGPILDRLEANAEEVANPTAWMKKELLRKAGRVLAHADWLNRSIPGKMDLLEPLDLAQLKEPLSQIPEAAAMKIFKELSDKVFDIKDPTAYVIEEAKRMLPSGPLVEQMRKLNESGKLQEPIRIASAWELLSRVEPLKAQFIIRNLMSRAARIRSPTGWIRAECCVMLRPRPAVKLGGGKGAVAGKGACKGKGAAAKPAAPVKPCEVAKPRAEAVQEGEGYEDVPVEGETDEGAAPAAEAAAEEDCTLGGDDGEDLDAIC